MLKKSLVGVLVLFTVAVSLAWFVDFDATELGRAALRQASASTGIRLEASRYRLRLFHGLELDNVEASARFPGGRYEITMPLMRFEHRLASLVGGTVELERVVLSQPRVAIATGLEPDPTTASPKPATPRRRRERSETPLTEAPGPPVELRLRELELADAAFSFNDSVSLTGVDLRLDSPTLAPGALTILHAVAATGEFSIQELSFRTTEVRNIVASLRASGGRFDLVDGAFETERAAFQVTSIHLDFNSLPLRYRLSLTGRHTELPGSMSFEGEGFGLDAMNLKGEGHWSVAAGVFDDAPLWRTTELTGTERVATQFPFAISEGRIIVDGDWIRGTIGLEGGLDLMVNEIEIEGTLDAPVRR